MAKANNFMRLMQLSEREVVRPRTEGSFCILRDADDMATLIELRGKGHISKEARKRLNEFVEDKTRVASTRLKKWLGLIRGAPRNFSKRDVWAIAAALREKSRKRNSWRSLARRLDRKGYAEDPHLAMDRMRHGVGAVRKDRRGKSKSA